VGSVFFQFFHEGPGAAAVSIRRVNEEFLNGAAERPSLRARHLEHHDAGDLGAQDASAGLRRLDKDVEDPRAVLDLGHAILPPLEQLVMCQRWEKRGYGSVVRDARGVDGRNVRNKVHVVARLEAEDHSHCRGSVACRLPGLGRRAIAIVNVCFLGADIDAVLLYRCLSFA
jgi:hypothetical protein